MKYMKKPLKLGQSLVELEKVPGEMTTPDGPVLQIFALTRASLSKGDRGTKASPDSPVIDLNTPEESTGALLTKGRMQ